MLQGKWYFPSNGYGVFNGINDPGITTFTADITGHVNSLVREVIQNSLDAVKDDGKPVVVEFGKLDLRMFCENVWKKIKLNLMWLNFLNRPYAALKPPSRY